MTESTFKVVVDGEGRRLASYAADIAYPQGAIPPEAIDFSAEDHRHWVENPDLRWVGGAFVAPPPRPLAEIKAALKSQVDGEAEAARRAFITPGEGQAMVYQEKARQAAEWLAASSPDPADYPLLSASVGIEGGNESEVAQAVMAVRAQWLAISAQVEALRLGAKAAIEAAQDQAAAEAAAASIAWPSPGQ